VSQLHEGDTLVEISTGMMRPVGDRVAALGARLGTLTDSGGKVLRLLQSQVGTAGRLVGSGWPKVTKQTDQIARLARQATNGEGTLGHLMSGELGARVAKIRAAKDSISALITTGNGNVGRFRRDSTLQTQIAHLRSELDSLRAEYSGSDGIGRVKTDSTLTVEMTRLRAQITSLMADIKKHPLRYLK